MRKRLKKKKLRRWRYLEMVMEYDRKWQQRARLLCSILGHKPTTNVFKMGDCYCSRCWAEL